MTSSLPSGPGKPTAVDLPLSTVEHSALVELHGVLYRSLILEDGDPLQAMRFYLATKRRIVRGRGSSGIVNNRVFRSGKLLVVPYIWRDTVFVLIGDLTDQHLIEQRFPPGTIFTDALLAELTGVRGEPVPLQKDNGEALAVRGVREGKGFVVNGSRGQATLPSCVMTFAYWNPDLLDQTRLLNVQTGEYLDVKVRALGEETIAVRGDDQRALRYALETRDFRIDLWYSQNKEWLALESRTDGGRKIRYLIQ